MATTSTKQNAPIPVPAYGTPITAGYAPGQSAPARFDPNTGQALTPPSGGATSSGTDRVGGVSVNPNVPNADGTPYNAAKAAQANAGANAAAPVSPTVPGTPPVAPGAIPTTPGGTAPTSIVDTLKAAGQPSDFASRTTMAGAQGIANYTGTADQNTELLKKYTQGLATAQATGKAPDNAGTAMATVKASVPGNGYEGAATTDAYLQEEPIFAKIMDSFAELMSPPKQQESLVSQYQNLLKTSGVEQINTELLNARKVIDGTESDLRLETEKANGFASNSQIMALAAARNKSLMANYNSLLDTRNSLMDQINTTIQLSQQDRQYASQKLEQQMNFGFKMMEYRDKFQNNAKENYNNIIKAVGYQGLLESTGGDSHYTDMIERSLGLSPGGLAQLAAYTPPLTPEQKADYAYKNASLAETMRHNKADERIASIKAGGGGTSSGGTYVPGANPIVDSWAERIQNGSAKITEIPSTQVGLRNQVSVALQAMGNSPEGKPTTTELGKAALTNAKALMKDFEAGTGTSAIGGSRFWGAGAITSMIPGSAGANFTNDFNAIKSQLALEGVKYLKGQGQVSDAERALLAQATTKLNLSQSQGEFKKTLQGIIDKLEGNAPNGANATSVPKLLAPTDIPSGYYQANDGLLYKK